MTSEERRQARYERRVKARHLKRKNSVSADYLTVCSQKELEKAYYKCRKGVRWKATVQKFGLHLYRRTRQLSNLLYGCKWESKGFNEFDIIERGHPRHILSVDISERCIQRSLCDNYLVPLLSKPLIYDNGATLPNKGIDFSIKRFKAHLEKFIRKNGSQGWIVFFDFSSYFANIDNTILIHNTSKYLLDFHLYLLYSDFIFAFGPIGLGLGSQVSQISAVFYPNKIDHYIKESLRIKYYARYMDDGYAIFKSFEDAMTFKKIFSKLCEEIHIKINPNKCKCVPIQSDYVFLKKRIFVDDKRIVMRVGRSVSRKERHRLRKYKKLLNADVLTYDEIYLNFHSWLCIYYNKNNFFMLLNIIRYYNELFDTEYYPRKIRNRKEKVLNYMAKRAACNRNIERR